MPSEKQIDTVARMLDPDAFTLEKTMLLMKGEMFGHHGDRVRAARGKAEELLTAAEQAEPAPDTRSGAVKVRKLEWVDTGQRGFLEKSYFAISGSLKHTCSPWEKDDGPFPEHYAISFRERELQPWVLRYWVGNNGLSGLVDSFSTPEEAKAAAQADYEKRILAALEPAEPAADEGPVRPAPSDARLREAVERYEATANHVGGCGDGNCVVARPIGQHTNGGCRCYTDKMKAQRMMRAGQMLCTAIRAALKEARE